jgi:hypothetical protein
MLFSLNIPKKMLQYLAIFQREKTKEIMHPLVLAHYE